jgi:hypothetical protein
VVLEPGSDVVGAPLVEGQYGAGEIVLVVLEEAQQLAGLQQ